MVNVAIAGLGYWGPNLVRNFQACRRTAVTRLCDPDKERLRAAQTSWPAVRCSDSIAAALEDPAVDAIAIATPVSSHYRLAKLALEAGKHVLVEKPLAASVREAEELVALARRAGRVLLVDHVFVHSPAVKKMAEVVRSGEVGDLLFVDSVRINLGLLQHDVNVLWDLAPHDLSIIDHLIERPARSVVAVGATRGGRREDVAYLHLEYGSDLLASVHVNWLSPVKVRYFLVGGSRRSILYDDLNQSERVKIYDRGIDVSNDPDGIRDVLVSYRSGDVFSPRLDSTEPLVNLVEHFVDCIEHGTTPISGGAQGLRVVRILAAAEESLARGGARIAL